MFYNANNNKIWYRSPQTESRRWWPWQPFRLTPLDTESRRASLKLDGRDGAHIALADNEALYYLCRDKNGATSKELIDTKTKGGGALHLGRLDGRTVVLVVYRDRAGGLKLALKCEAARNGPWLTTPLAGALDTGEPLVSVLDEKMRLHLIYFHKGRSRMEYTRLDEPLSERPPRRQTVIPLGPGGGAADMVVDERGRPVIVWQEAAAQNLHFARALSEAPLSLEDFVFRNLGPVGGAFASVAVKGERMVIAFQGRDERLKLLKARGDSVIYTTTVDPHAGSGYLNRLFFRPRTRVNIIYFSRKSQTWRAAGLDC